MTMNRRGFTLIELLVGIVLVGIVGGAIYQVLVNSQRVYTLQTQRAAMNDNNRTAVTILPAELREVAATDVLGSDIIQMSATAITYKAMRSLRIICADPDVMGSRVLVRNDLMAGMRWWNLDVGTDSLLIFVEGNPATRTDNTWLHASYQGSGGGALCADGLTQGTWLVLDGIAPAGALAGVRIGAPVRAFVVMQFETYTDGLGDGWLGARRYAKGGGWPGQPQPVLGPLANAGFQLTYFDEDGNTTVNTDEVARVGIRIVGQTLAPVRGPNGLARAQDQLETAVALRNNNRGD
jgi:prepilin-type N-terminal cleavage/methylation domain-containing protein